jgi:hypothetical protein
MPLMRLVTIALAMYSARALLTFTFSPPQAHLIGKFGRNLHERLGHELHVHGIVLGPVDGAR